MDEYFSGNLSLAEHPESRSVNLFFCEGSDPACQGHVFSVVLWVLLSYSMLGATGIQGCVQLFPPPSLEVWGLSHFSYAALQIRKLRLKEAMSCACGHVTEHCQDKSLVTAVPKPSLLVTGAGRRGKQDSVEKGGAGPRLCGRAGRCSQSWARVWEAGPEEE